MGWSWTWWIFSARMWAIVRRPTTKTRWSTTARGGSLWAEVDLPRNLTLTASLHLKWMVGIRSLWSFPFGANCLFSRDMWVFRELYLHWVWKKTLVHVHRPFWPSLKRGWDLFVAECHSRKVSGLPLGVSSKPRAVKLAEFAEVVVKRTELEQKNTIYRCLFVEILTKKRCEIWWVLIPCSGAAFWRFQFGNGKTRLLLGMFRREGQWSPGPKNGSTNKIHHVCGPFLVPSFLSQLAICKSIIATWFLYPVYV